ncbi:hypothetical protein [Pontibacter ruber]|uniref:DnrO protein n=1 Tax=Pontibacter ruber TaxID=1343895 RepID=A0ABW5CVT6_9BACT|nr:hypothetical protein [Pontibacter ruber]
MKIVAAAILLASLVSTCGHEDADQETTHQEEVQITQTLALNNGERWQADDATNQNMQALQQLLQDFAKQSETQSLDAYNDLGSAMRSGLQQLFTDCTMKGPAHDMLHTFLLPIAEDIALLEGKDETEAMAAHSRINGRLAQYSAYFQ